MSSKDEDQKAVEQAQLLKRALEEIGTPAYFERLAFIATDRIHRYKAHLAAGFSEQQALELCK